MAHTYLHPDGPLATLHQDGAVPGTSEPPLSSFQPSSGPQCQHPNSFSDQPTFSSSSAAQQQQRVATVGPRSSSLPQHLPMGLNQSKPTPPTPNTVASPSPPLSAATKGLTAAVSSNLKRTFARRRKNSEDASKLFSPKSKEQQEVKLRGGVSSPSLATGRAAKSAPPITVVQHSTPPRIESTKHHPPPLPLHQNIVRLPLHHSPSPPMPPTPPKKDTPPPSHVRTEVPSAGSRSSVISNDAAISSAVNYISLMDQHHVESEVEKDGGKSYDKHEMKDCKESWRKSDSTNSHHTIRPPAGTPARSSRPVSWADSIQSGHTVKPPSNKRRSALICDADFGMPEEEDEDVSATFHAAKSSPNASTRSLNRRSMSLNLGSPVHLPPVAAVDIKSPSHSISGGFPLYSSNLSPRSTSQPTAPNDLRGRVTVPNATPENPHITVPPVSQERKLSPAAPYLPQPSTSPSSFRQTAISFSGGVGPAAANMAKRAVDKIGRRWAQGIGFSSSSSGSGGLSSSSSSMNEPAISTPGSSQHGDVLVRTSSNLSVNTSSIPFFPHHNIPFRGGHKRTPNAHSGAGSVSSISVASGSDSDFFTQATGPILGERLRGAMRSKNGAQVIAGVVFGRDLAAGVRDTGVRVGKPPRAEGKRRDGLLGQFEERMLAAVAVRCAQHLLLWGIQEEGLFRVPGRSAHVSKLRSEFDSGADYDMAECSPGDLDPHAVASVFKAYLRELPEPILTQKLQPLFDAAINKEASKNAVDTADPPRLGGRGIQGLPSGPKNGFTGGLRKPPSLSTLAMPSFTGIPPASQALINAIHGLIKQLPIENRDLLLTIVDLIKETAKHSKETKMPLSNLLVVFCPSLNMTPPLLKTLCEVEGIWDARSELADIPAVIDIRRQPIAKEKERERDNDSSSETHSRMGEESASISSSRPSLDNPSSDYHGSAEESIYEGRAIPRMPRPDYDRSEVPTVYLDTRSHLSSTSSVSSLLQENTQATAYDVPSSQHMRDLASDNGSISSGGGYSMHNAPLSASSPPPLSSSAESIVTPTSSGNPSFTDLPLNAKDQESQHSLGMQHERHNGSGPLIFEASSLELHVQANRRPFISKPMPITSGVQFPMDSPTTPSPTMRRRSILMLSLPSITPISPMQPSPQAAPHTVGQGSEPRTLRGKKPSLKLLFSKRSTSSLNSAKERVTGGISFISAPIPQGSRQVSPKSGSDSSSVSTPVSAVTAPQGSGSASASCTQFPPVLDTPIEDSPFSMDLGFDISPPPTATPSDKQLENPKSAYTSPAAAESGKGSSKTHPSNSPYGPKQAALETQPLKLSSRRTIKPGENHIRPQASSSNLSIVSTASSHHLSLFDDDNDEGMEGWTQSVLLAADVDGKWVIQTPDAKSS